MTTFFSRRPHRNSSNICLLWLTLFLFTISYADAILQTAQLDISFAGSEGAQSHTMLVSQASFGSPLKMGVEKNEGHRLQLPPVENPLLCQNVTGPTNPSEGGNYIMLVPRGQCTFENKAWNAQKLGAVGLIVRGTLASSYSLNETTSETIFPSNKNDYDCDKGKAEIPTSAVVIPYDSNNNDPVLSGDTSSNLCMKESPLFANSCDSKACFLTSNFTENKANYVACCAWDLHIWLYNDPSISVNVDIPAVYATMEQGQKLLKLYETSSPLVTMSARVRAPYNFSAILIWLLGVIIAAIAAYSSATDYRRATQVINRKQEQEQKQEHQGLESDEEKDEQNTERLPLTDASTTENASLISLGTSFPHEESLELNAGHAFGFIVLASSGLLTLFFFKIYSVVKVMYTLGCSNAVRQVIFLPLFSFIFRQMKITDRVVYRSNIEDIGDLTLLDIISGITSYILGFGWLYVAFTTHNREPSLFFWMMQDIMGACICVVFLGSIKLNSMRVASILLLMAFFYDIFFVFVTPLLFKGQSVMITVATSGGPPKADPLWCEKYPNDSNCQGGDPLPMLLTVPRIFDYQGGSSMLGLGDIVLPGLLLSFAARLDAAKQLMGVISGNMHNYKRICCSHNSYFRPMIVAYAIGLLMANAAVYLMNMGQPALLYLVPMCVGTMSFLGWRRNELSMLWEGPKIIRTADALLYGPDEDYHDEQNAEINDNPDDRNSSNLVA
mmetsp:Transcript_17687/g.20372  ORF Transcript_17687/g.20372 Transcript_17687/m.20372 type:complete len:727 (+) Transcript_17687:82-2262(+)|eukprot:CAMPEP_0194138028 /NCGR_PEP_ID=MMETSP0152-20130528/7868_1 /TAXON_ID=1049557 /ORGANISM="Thalassiothrix antarctica, Strain L6-D1" /LENGTH=726 /DNA_ID=CAMNT_0038835305 /DNA_START=67 /DNA_END=2247 /DNA_ORIENTATION=-